jgi:3-deoxy-manno-octulosonate cytidylyltransferase (CMP-KDO synthetase)
VRTIALVPARLESTRLEKKLLSLISNTPLIVLTVKNLINSKLFDEVCVITDSDEIIDILIKYSIKFFKSKGNHDTGTDRISEFANKFNCDVIINVQGDEPFINKSDLNLIINNFKNDNTNEIEAISLKTNIKNIDEIEDSSNVKVITDSNSNAIYFSRNPIPHNRSGNNVKYFKHIGVYAFRKNALIKFSKLKKSKLEQAEMIEAIRFIDNGMKIKILEVFNNYIGIDTIEDLKKARKIFND